MDVTAILNRDGGTLRTMDLAAYVAHLQEVFEAEGHSFSAVICAGTDLEQCLKNAADSSAEVILAGGGDGTVSAAAIAAWKGDKALGVIPAGTMNLFARSIGVPLDIWEAATALAAGEIRSCDIATANGRAFVHQFSVGMQPRMVHERDEESYGSRFGKMIASTKAVLAMLTRPPAFDARITKDGNVQDTDKFSMIAVSNNLYGEGHIPYADRVDGGVLGVYCAGVLDSAASAKLAADLLLGNWSANVDFKSGTAQEVVLEFPHLKSSAQAAIDGELIALESKVKITVHPGALKVLMPGK